MTIHTDFLHNVLKGVELTKITSPFGWRWLFGVYSKHNGIDIKPTIAITTKVISYEKALVSKVGYSSTAGNYIELIHGDDAETYYAHLVDNSIPHKVGDVIDRAVDIGTMGKTGIATGIHCHFGVKIKGFWVDPLPYLQGKLEITPYKETYTMIRPELPILRVLVDSLYYRDAPNGKRIAKLKRQDYAYLGHTELIGGYRWGQIVLIDDTIVWTALNQEWNTIIPIPPKPLPFHVELDQDGQHLIVDLQPINK